MSNSPHTDQVLFYARKHTFNPLWFLCAVVISMLASSCSPEVSNETKELRRKAEQGDANSQYKLGKLYFDGDEELPQSDTNAAKYWLMAAKQGHGEAQLEMGILYEKGKGVAQDNTESINWFTKSALNGNRSAQFYLGQKYYLGNGAEQDYDKAADWLLMAKKLKFELADVYLSKLDPNADPNTIEWMEALADKGYVPAQYNLGVHYFQGRAVRQDYVKAYMWLNIAATSGNQMAKAARDQVDSKMTPEQLKEAEKLVLQWLEKHSG